MRLQELADAVGLVVEGNGDRPIHAAASLESAGAADISFVGNAKAWKQAAVSQAGALVVTADFPAKEGTPLLRTKDPRAIFARIVAILHPQPVPPPGVHPTAVVAASAIVHETALVGPNCVVGEEVRIGAHSVLRGNVTIYDRVEIGERCLLHSGCVLGADGFGFVFENGQFHKFPQVGRVVIGNDVEIGANSTVDRAALGVTTIGDGSKLDNMVHVGHNCQVGKHVVIAAQTGMAGGTVIEDYAIIGGQVGMGDNVRIESGAVVGSGAGILSNKVVHRGQPMWGTPARPLKDYLANLANLSRLDELRRRVRVLEDRLK